MNGLVTEATAKRIADSLERLERVLKELARAQPITASRENRGPRSAQ